MRRARFPWQWETMQPARRLVAGDEFRRQAFACWLGVRHGMYRLCRSTLWPSRPGSSRCCPRHRGLLHTEQDGFALPVVAVAVVHGTADCCTGAHGPGVFLHRFELRDSGVLLKLRAIAARRADRRSPSSQPAGSVEGKEFAMHRHGHGRSSSRARLGLRDRGLASQSGCTLLPVRTLAGSCWGGAPGEPCLMACQGTVERFFTTVRSYFGDLMVERVDWSTVGALSMTAEHRSTVLRLDAWSTWPWMISPSMS